MKKIIIKSILLILFAAFFVSGCGDSRKTDKDDTAAVTTEDSDVPKEKACVEEENRKEVSKDEAQEVIVGNFTEKQLTDAAEKYYGKYSQYGSVPPVVEIDSYDGDNAVIHLYECTQGHTATYDWYTINIYTGEGEDFEGNYINLTETMDFEGNRQEMK